MVINVRLQQTQKSQETINPQKEYYAFTVNVNKEIEIYELPDKLF